MAKQNELTADNLKALYAHAQDLLPAYARPCFLRFQNDLEVTSTFKQRKVVLVKEGFDPSQINDSLFCIDYSRKTYVPLDGAVHDNILNGVIRL